MAFKHYLVSSQEEGLRLVNFIKAKTKSFYSLKKIKKAMEKGICRLNGKTECFASVKVKKGDAVEIAIEQILPSELVADQKTHKVENFKQQNSFKDEVDTSKIKKSEIAVLFEDEYFLIINKPTFLLCSDSLIRKYFPETFLVHRLDLKTSGLLILAKSKKVKKEFIKIFSSKNLKKTYLAIVDGHLNQKKGKICSFLQPKNRFAKSAKKTQENYGKILFKSHPKVGLKAVTLFKTLTAQKKYSAVLFFPITGRTHQIRVHALELGHPILGDYQYFQEYEYSDFVPRLLLHSYQLEFLHPIKRKNIKIEAPIPQIFKKFLRGIKKLEKR